MLPGNDRDILKTPLAWPSVLHVISIAHLLLDLQLPGGHNGPLDVIQRELELETVLSRQMS